MTPAQVVLILGFFLVLSGRKTCSQSCPIFGTDQGEQSDYSRRERIFLNFESPSHCSGTVTEWRYCYYRDRDVYNQLYGAKLLIYRKGLNSNIYQPVPNSVVLVSILGQELASGFTCLSRTLNMTEQFQILENDIIAACIIQDGTYDPLRLVGEGGSDDLYQYNPAGYQACTTSQLQIVDTQNSDNDFRLRTGHKLHLYVNVDGPATSQFSGGSNPPPFSPSTASGTFLNTASPVQRTDTITAWHYCYYPPSNTSITYTATIGVWRLNDVSSQYELVAGSNYTLILQPESTPARIICITVYLQEEEYVRVNQGDVIGVTLPAQNFIQLVGSQGTSAYSLRTLSNQLVLPSNILASQLSSETTGLALHLYPDIESIPQTTTTPPPTSATVDTTTPPLTTVNTMTPPPSTVETTTLHSRETTTTPQPPLTFDTRTATLSPTIGKTSNQPTLFETTTLLSLSPQQTAMTATTVVIGVALLLVSISVALLGIMIMVVVKSRRQKSNGFFASPSVDPDDESFQATYLEIVDSTSRSIHSNAYEAHVDSINTSSSNEAYGGQVPDRSRSHNGTETSQMQVALDTTTQNVAYVPMPSSEEGDNEYEYI